MVMIRPWSEVHSRVVSENRIFTLKKKTARSPRTGGDHDFFLLEAGGWVNIIPVTSSGEVLLVRQYRHGSDEITLEIPGGLIDDGQTPEEAAARELREETGYRAAEMIALGRVRPNPAFLDNWCYMFLARDVVRVGDIEQDDGEDLELVRRPLSEIPNMIARGDINHSLVITAFYFHDAFRADAK